MEESLKIAYVEVRTILDILGKDYQARIPNKVKKLFYNQNIDSIASNDEIGIDDIITLENGKTTSIREEALKDKVSPEEFLGKYKSRAGKTPDEIIENVHDEIEEEYIGKNNRER